MQVSEKKVTRVTRCAAAKWEVQQYTIEDEIEYWELIGVVVRGDPGDKFYPFSPVWKEDSGKDWKHHRGFYTLKGAVIFLEEYAKRRMS